MQNYTYWDFLLALSERARNTVKLKACFMEKDQKNKTEKTGHLTICDVLGKIRSICNNFHWQQNHSYEVREVMKQLIGESVKIKMKGYIKEKGTMN